MMNMNYLNELDGDVSHLSNNLDYNLIDEKIVPQRFQADA